MILKSITKPITAFLNANFKIYGRSAGCLVLLNILKQLISFMYI